MSKQYNIMTSCDDSHVAYVAVGLTSMANNLNGSHVDFYLFHSQVSHDNIEMLDKLCTNFDNGTLITFHEINIPDGGIYDELAKYGNGDIPESYYALASHLLLPQDMDRILYLDLANMIITNDIYPYYNYSFNGKSLIVTGSRYCDINGGNSARVYTADDIGDHEKNLPIILNGLFSASSYIINLKKFREDERTLADYQYLTKVLRESLGKDKEGLYSGVQGLLSFTFVGDIQYYYFNEVKNVFYMPYNFCLWYYNAYTSLPPFNTAIIHYSGTDFKPWEGRYPIHLKRFQPGEDKLHSLDELKDNQAGYFYQWHEYAIIADSILEKIGY